VTYRTVVTGASSGIGRATALLLAKSGHALVLNARREHELNRVAESCLAAGACAVSVVAGDVAEPDTAPRFADAVEQSGSGPVVLVNSAGTAEFGPFHACDLEQAVQGVQVGLCGAMRAVHALLPLMLEEGRGTVVNVVSIAARHTFPNAEAYTAAKSGLLGFSRSLSASYRGRGVRVTAVVPGATDTPLWGAQSPPREDMLPAMAVAETVKCVIDLPWDRVVDEIVVTPPKGVL
jgi:3-oxoacyl-[acyl-carrier protein] reductase